MSQLDILKFLLAIAISVRLQGCFAQGPQHVGCFVDQGVTSGILFKVSPGGYDPIALSPFACAASCQGENFKYAGLQEGKFCFCSDTEPTVAGSVCNSSCSQNVTDVSTCGGKDLNTDVYTAFAAVPLQGLLLSVDNANDTTGQPVTFTPSLQSGSVVRFRMNYGDGSPLSSENATGYMKHVYYIPGNYVASVYASDDFQPTKVIRDHVDIVVNQGVEDLFVDCPKAVNPNEIFSCTISLVKGTNVDISIDMGDGNGEKLFKMPAPKLESFGYPVPQTPIDYMQSGSIGLLSILGNIIHHAAGYIIAIEAYAVSAGSVTFQVLQATCASGQYCFETNSCEISCPSNRNEITCSTGFLCPAAKVCSDKCNTSFLELQFVQVASYNAILAAGFNHIDLKVEEYMKVTPGCVLGFDSSSGIVAYRNVTDEEVSRGLVDITSSSLSGPWTPTTIAHLANGIISRPASVQIQRSYLSTGNYTVSVECSNDIPTTVRNTSVIAVAAPVSGLDLTLTPSTALSNTPFSIVATLENGSDITFTWMFGTNMNETTFQNSTTPGVLITQEHTFASEGVFEITVFAENVLNSVNKSLMVTVQNHVTTQWALKSDSPIVQPPGTVTLTVSWTGSGAIPTSPSYTFSWGDGPKSDLEFPNTTTEVITSHNFTSGGIFNCSVFIYNLLSNHTVDTIVEVFEEIQGLNAQVYYVNADVGPEMKKGRGSMGEIVPKQSNVSIVMSKLKGTVVTYLVEDDIGALLMNTSSSTIPYYVGENGFYNLSIYGWNPVQGKSSPLSIALMADDEFSDVIVDDFFITTDAMTEKTFEIRLGSIGTESCAIIDFGDQTDSEYPPYPIAYGANEICFENYTYDDIDYKGSLTDPMNVTHLYRKLGKYKISVQLFSGELRSETSMIFSVTNFSCPTPQFSIKDSATTLSQPKQYVKSESFRIDTNTVISCGNTTLNTTRMWSIARVDEFGGELESIDLSSLTSSNKSAFFVPGGFLSYGVYRIVYLLCISAEGMDYRYPFCHSVFTYVEIIQTPYLIGKMTNDVSTRLIRGLQQNLYLMPANFSIDPDFPDDKDFNVTWFCRRVFPSEETIPKNGTNYDTSNPLKIPSSKPSSDGGGCFGTGPGAIDIREGYWIMNTSVLYSTDIVFEISAIVSKSDRHAEAKLEVETVVGNPPGVSISCQNEGLCFPSESGTIINPTTRLALIARCHENCDSQLLYDWKLLDSQTGMEITEGTLYMTGYDTYNVAIKKDFFGNNTGITNAVIQMTATRDSDGVEGLARMKVILNAPPVGGLCSMTPRGGIALLDKFELSCVGWSDPEGGPIAQYAFSAVNANGTEQVLSFDSASTKTVILPYGTLDIIVKISDGYGATTEYIIEEGVEIELPSQEAYEQFLNSTTLSNIVCGGNQQEICQIFAAIASIQNSGLLIPTSSGNETKDEIVTYDYQATMGERITYLIESLQGITAENLPSMEMVAGTLSLIVANGDGVDLNGKKLAVKQLESLWASLEKNVEFASPSDAKQFAQSSISVMGGVATAIMNTVINGEVLPSDLNNVNNIVYDTYAGNDYDFEIPTSLDDMHVAAIRADTSHQGRDEIVSMTNMVKVLSSKILQVYVAGEEPMTLETQSDVLVTIGKFVGANLSSTFFRQKDTYFQLPDHCLLLELGGKCKGNKSVGVAAVSWPGILQSFAKNTDNLAPNTRTLQLEIYDQANKLLKIGNTTEPIHMIIPRNMKDGGSSNNASEPTEVIPSLMWNEFMMYHQFNVTKPDAAVNVEISPGNLSMRAIVFLRYSKKPTLLNYDFSIRLVDTEHRNGTFQLFLSNDILGNKMGIFYLGIVEISPDLADTNYTANGNYSYDMVTRNFSCTYSLRIYTSGCYYYDEIRKQWLGRGCYVHAANHSMTYCMCTHLTTFGGGFLVMPNTVDFSYVFAHAGFNDNLTIYVTLILTFLVYLLLLVWARWKDKKDVEKLSAAPLPDNKPRDKYIYEIMVFTGNKASAATDSTVHFVLSGEKDETDVRIFGDDKRAIFRKGAMNAFIMTVPRPLGSLHFMRLWHDNSGKGQYASWYMNFIIVRDIQTGEEFNFIGDQWWAVEEGDGQIDRLVPVAGKEQMRAFSHVFSTTSQTNLADGHLWFSIFMRPPRSRFTRVQRVSCCVAFLYLTMLVNAMWYGTSVDTPNTSGFRLGPFSLTTEQIGVGIISNVIVFLPNFVIVFLFRKSSPRKLRPSRVNNALATQNLKSDNVANSKTSLDNTSGDISSMGSKTELIKDNKDGESKNDRKPAPIPEKKFTLPWFFVILAWLLIIATIGASVFFLWAYGIQFGNEKTKKWITSLVISFFASVFITQPIKVFLIALLFSAICKKVDDDADDADEDEVDPLLYPDEEWLHGKPGKRRSINIRPLDPEYLKRAREERLKEIKMWAVLKEVFAYLLFLLVLVVISYGNRDPNGYFLKRTLENEFVQNGQDNGFNNIKETKSFWTWTREILTPSLHAQELYNDVPPFGLKGFLKDQVNRLMGYAVLRQIRFKPNACSPPKEMRNKSSCTGLFTNFVHEDRSNYGLGWNDTFKVDFYTDVTDTEFQYKSASALDGYPTIGALDMYSGGGYIFKMDGYTDDILKRLKVLEDNDWIDRHTRAVYIEFSVYNAQVNLFGIASMWVEFFAGGGATPHYRFDGIKLLYYYRNFGLFLLVCEVVFVLFILYFTFREMRQLCRERKGYFKSYWNFAEMAIILISYVAIGVYIYRKVVTTNLLKRFNETKGNGYIKLQFVYSLDEIYGYLLAFVVFVSTLKFNKLLRFNKRMGMLSSTLSHACGDLAWFSVAFLIVFLAFVQLFYLLLTTHMVDFSDFISAIEYCLTMMLQKFDLSRINSACPVLGTVAFFFFSLITTIVLINLFLTIVIKSFQEVAHDMAKQSNEYELVEFIKKRFAAFIGIGRGASWQLDEQPQLNSNKAVKKDEGDTNVNGLPEKVDQLLDYINVSYFDGKMKLEEQVAMKGMFSRPKTTYSDSN